MKTQITRIVFYIHETKKYDNEWSKLTLIYENSDNSSCQISKFKTRTAPVSCTIMTLFVEAVWIAMRPLNMNILKLLGIRPLCTVNNL